MLIGCERFGMAWHNSLENSPETPNGGCEEDISCQLVPVIQRATFWPNSSVPSDLCFPKLVLMTL